MPIQTTFHITAPKFEPEAQNAVSNQINADELAGKFAPPPEPDQKQTNQEIAGCLKELNGDDGQRGRRGLRNQALFTLSIIGEIEHVRRLPFGVVHERI